MRIVDSTRRALDDGIVRDVLNYKSQLVDEYQFDQPLAEEERTGLRGRHLPHLVSSLGAR